MIELVAAPTELRRRDVEQSLPIRDEAVAAGIYTDKRQLLSVEPARSRNAVSGAARLGQAGGDGGGQGRGARGIERAGDRGRADPARLT